MRDATPVPRECDVASKSDSLGVILNGFLGAAVVTIVTGQVSIRFCVLWIETNGFLIIQDRLTGFAFPVVGETASVVCCGVFRIASNGLIIVRHCIVELALFSVGKTAQTLYTGSYSALSPIASEKRMIALLLSPRQNQALPQPQKSDALGCFSIRE